MTGELLAPALDYATGSAARITLADLGRPSTCAGWTVADVLVHLTQSLRFLAVSLASGAVLEPADAATGPVTARTLRRDLDDAAASLTAAARDLRGRQSVDVDGMPLRCRQLVVVGAIEAAAHGWDAARGAGCARPMPGDLAAGLLAELPQVLDDDTRRGMFADPVVLPGDRPAGERLLAALGRVPTVP
jgi:uncharacterized protein (TIGR03086 family)